MGVLAVGWLLNIFGGFLVTRRMLEMFKKKEKRPLPPDKGATPMSMNTSRCCTGGIGLLHPGAKACRIHNLDPGQPVRP